MEIAKISNVSVSYDNCEALSSASLTINKSDFIGVIGPNGGGKTTLIKTILGLIKPTSGEISLRKGLKVGYMPQHRTLDKDFPLSVKEVVLSGLQGNSLHYRPSKTERENCDRLLKECALEDVKDRQIGELSGGQLQRVLLCRSIVSEPDLLILDEPTTYVDSRFQVSFYELLEELNAKMAIVMVSHDLGTICSYVRSIACINRTLHYHPSAEITPEILSHYDCPLKIVGHGEVAHSVLKKH